MGIAPAATTGCGFPSTPRALERGGESDDEDEKNMRPVDIEADVKEMERRKRVEAIMNSQLFREELERVVGDSLRESGSESLAGLLSDVMNIKSGSKSSFDS